MNTESNPENIKHFLEQVTGSELSLKKGRISEEDLKQELFNQIIFAIEKVNNRSLLIETDFNISHYKYDENFHEIIDALFVMHFGVDITNVILFYLYERVNPDGSLNGIADNDGNSIILNNPSELWAFIKLISPEVKPKKKGKKDSNEG